MKHLKKRRDYFSSTSVSSIFSWLVSVHTPRKVQFLASAELWMKLGHIPPRTPVRTLTRAISIHVGFCYFKNRKIYTTSSSNPWFKNVGNSKAIWGSRALLSCNHNTFIYIFVTSFWSHWVHRCQKVCRNFIWKCIVELLTAVTDFTSVVLFITFGGKQSLPAHFHFQPAWSPTLAKPAKKRKHR